MKQKYSPKVSYQCLECNHKLTAKKTICPKCNTKKRKVYLKLRDSITIYNNLRTKTRKDIGGKTKITEEQKIGDDYHRKTKKWNFLHRIIDRLNDRYYEVIKDRNTGKVIEETEEKLSEHQGHGSAKYKKK